MTMTALPVGAQLIGTQFSFPEIYQTSNAVAWAQDYANTYNYQQASVSFPTYSTGFGGVAFPCIDQTSLQTQTMYHSDYSQNTQTTVIGYPYLGITGI
jgi:hypothetical protein